MYKDVRTSPLEHKSLMELTNIYTDLAMLSEGMRGKKTKKNYKDFIQDLENICGKKELKTRIALFGEPGIGKTTFLAKLAVDWALKKCLGGIELLFLIPLRKIEGTVGFCDYMEKHMISDSLKSVVLKVEDYIRQNQRKVLILYDGFDEYKYQNDENAQNDANTAVIRGDVFKDAPVVVTARSWKAEEMKSDTTLEKRYKFIQIKGFNREDAISCISKLFRDKEELRDDLTTLMRDENSLLAEIVTPYPIFCSMLCAIWQDGKGRKAIKGIKTVYQLFQVLVDHLSKHFAGKEESRLKQSEQLKEAKTSLQQFGEDALNLLLKKKRTFYAEDLKTSKEELSTLEKIGVLTKVQGFGRSDGNDIGLTQSEVKYEILHTLFQEYLAGVHLASLYKDKRTEFNEKMEELNEDYKSSKYILCFAASKNKKVGRAIRKSHVKNGGSGIADVDFQYLLHIVHACKERKAYESLTDQLQNLSSLKIDEYIKVELYETCGRLASRYAPDCCVTNESAAQAAYRFCQCLLCCLLRRSALSDVFPKLESLELENVKLGEAFFKAMASLAPKSVPAPATRANVAKTHRS